MPNLVSSLAHWRWPRLSGPMKPGYTLVLAVPPDLPVFLRLAVGVCRAQDTEGLNETLVVADHDVAGFESEVDRVACEWPAGRVRLVPHTPVSRFVRALQTSGAMIHWHQIVRAVSVACSQRIVLHDVDMMTDDRGLLRRLYREVEEGGVDCVGLEAPGVGPSRLVLPRYAHAVPCWEMALSAEWLRSMRPNALMPRKVKSRGENVHIETMVDAQGGLAADRVRGIRPDRGSYAHFSVLISTYRKYQRSEGAYHDHRFRLLLIRLLADAMDADGEYALPSAEELVRGIDDPACRVHYLPSDAANYKVFRDEAERMLSLGLFGTRAVKGMREVLACFDAYFGWGATVSVAGRENGASSGSLTGASIA